MNIKEITKSRLRRQKVSGWMTWAIPEHIEVLSSLICDVTSSHLALPYPARYWLMAAPSAFRGADQPCASYPAASSCMWCRSKSTAIRSTQLLSVVLSHNAPSSNLATEYFFYSLQVAATAAASARTSEGRPQAADRCNRLAPLTGRGERGAHQW